MSRPNQTLLIGAGLGAVLAGAGYLWYTHTASLEEQSVADEKQDEKKEKADAKAERKKLKQKEKEEEAKVQSTLLPPFRSLLVYPHSCLGVHDCSEVVGFTNLGNTCFLNCLLQVSASDLCCIGCAKY